MIVYDRPDDPRLDTASRRSTGRQGRHRHPGNSDQSHQTETLVGNFPDVMTRGAVQLDSIRAQNDLQLTPVTDVLSVPTVTTDPHHRVLT